jgi:hypothetical protein
MTQVALANMWGRIQLKVNECKMPIHTTQDTQDKEEGPKVLPQKINSSQMETYIPILFHFITCFLSTYLIVNLVTLKT